MSFLKSAVFEVIIVIVLALLVIFSLNYFKVISLGQSFSFLSFLPQKSQQYNSPEKINSQTVAIITPDNLRTISNNSSTSTFQYVKNSMIKADGGFTLEGEIATSLKQTQTSNTSGSGVIFKNKYEYGDPNGRRLRVFYFLKDKNWVLEYRGNSKSQFYYLAKDKNSTPFIKFNLVIDPSGRSVDAYVAGQKTSKISFPGSIYDKGKDMSMVAEVGPSSSLTIYSLYYQY